MSRNFKIKQIKEAEYEDASLNLTILLPMGSAGNIPSLKLNYTCPNCSGYGCRHGNGPCDDNTIVEIKNLKETIGEEQTKYLIDYFERMINIIKIAK